MGVSLELDKRYKVNNEIIERMKELKKQGISNRQIGFKLGLSANTVTYWLEEDYRDRQRRKIAKRKYTNNLARIRHAKEQKAKFRLDYALGYIAKQCNTLEYLKGDHLILGISMRKHWLPYLKQTYQKGSRKLGI